MSDDQKSTPKIYVMPEQFLALTRSAGLPVSRVPAPVPAPMPVVPPTPTPPAPAPKPVGAPAASTLAPVPTPPVSGVPVVKEKRRMLIVWGIIGVVVLLGGGLAAFFALRSVPPPPAPAPRPSAPAPTPPPPPAPVPPANVPPSPPESEPEPEPAPVPPAADVDTDRDGLTDAEELLFGTDVALADTDRDGYADALELQNLYNPAGVAPQRLLDAGLVYEYENTRYGWKVFVPRAWSTAATDQEQREVVVTTQVSGESLTFTVTPADEVTGSVCAGLPEVRTKRGATGCRNVEEPLATFTLPNGDVLSIAYRVATPPTRFPHAFDMMVESFAASAAPSLP